MVGTPLSETGTGHPGAEGPKKSEAPQPAKPEATKPVDVLGTRAALQALDTRTPGKPDRPDLESLAGARAESPSPWDQFMAEAAKGDSTPLVGGELIGPTAMRVGEASPQQARERGWLSAITGANATELPRGEINANIQKIVDAAKAAGVSPDVLRAHVQKLGLSTGTAEQAQVNTIRSNKAPQQGAATESTAKTAENKGDPIQGSIDRIRIIGAAALQDQQNPDLANQLKAVLAEAVNAGVSREQIRAQLTEMGFNVVNKDAKQQNQQEIPEHLTREDYASLVGDLGALTSALTYVDSDPTKGVDMAKMAASRDLNDRISGLNLLQLMNGAHSGETPESRQLYIKAKGVFNSIMTDNPNLYDSYMKAKQVEEQVKKRGTR